MKRIPCAVCGAELGNREIALNLKTRGRSVGTFFCLSCLAAQLGGSVQALNEMADYYTENHCELFERQYVDRR